MVTNAMETSKKRTPQKIGTTAFDGRQTTIGVKLSPGDTKID